MGTAFINPFMVAPSVFVFSATISSNTYNYNVQSAMAAAGWNGVLPFQATITINSGVTVGSTSTGTAAFVATSTFPAGSSLSVTNNGTIQGCGGSGGAGQLWNATGGSAGYGGGSALSISCPCTFNNTNGSILGGGGGGGGAIRKTNVNVGSLDKFLQCNIQNWTIHSGGGGGGGRGYYGGSGGSGGGTYSGGGAPAGSAQSGTAGTASSAGGGGAGSYSSGCLGTFYGYTGGNGGGAGSAGSTGGGPGFGGGAAGYAVVGNSNITWNGTGTRIGPIG